MVFHMYIAPGQWQTTLCGQNPDVTPGNVVLGNQSYANEIIMGASGHELLVVHRMSAIYNHSIYSFQIERIRKWAMWFCIVFISR